MTKVPASGLRGIEAGRAAGELWGKPALGDIVATAGEKGKATNGQNEC